MIQRNFKTWCANGNKRRNLAVFLIVLVTAVWGLTFVTVKDAVERMPVMDFLAARFLLATSLMVLFRPKSLFKLKWPDRGKAALLGFILSMGYITQTFALTLTTAAVTGFITGMFVVFTPLIASLVLRKPIDKNAWLAVVFAAAGLALISIRKFSIGYGELLALICALFYAIHIVGLGEWSKNRDPYSMAVIQLAVGALICTAAALRGGFILPPDTTAWWAVVITAVFATAFAFLIQTWAQSQISPTQIAVIMTMEPVFAGVFAVLIGGERLGLRTVFGGFLMVIAMYLVELGPRKAREGEIAHLEI